MNQKEEKYLNKVMKEYEEKEFTDFDKLKQLDKKAKRFSNIFAYIFGTISALILGLGMSIVLGEILVNYFYLGIVIGVLWLILVAINYPLYKKLKLRGMKKYSNEIKELSNKLLNN